MDGQAAAQHLEFSGPRLPVASPAPLVAALRWSRHKEVLRALATKGTLTKDRLREWRLHGDLGCP
eukprot:10130869-Prorocentrum_lima.AAC.1